MDMQKEALLRIMNTLNQKYETASAFQGNLNTDLQLLDESYEASILDLKKEFDTLYLCLQNKKDEMVLKIKNEQLKKKNLMQVQLKNYESACTDANELISLSKDAMALDSSIQFNKVALSIKNRITMAPIFRLSSSQTITELNCHLVVDLTREVSILNKMTFLPVPCTPLFSQNLCLVSNNKVTCEWSLPDKKTVEEKDSSSTFVEFFLFQYRQVSCDQGNHDIPWRSVDNVEKLNHTIQGLIFVAPYIQVRVQAWNKGIKGAFSSVLTLATSAFNFNLDPDARHANLKTTGPYSVSWDPITVKRAESRIKSSSSTSSPSKSGKKLKPTDRFIGESYTILGDRSVSDDDGDVYFEISLDPQCKTFSFGMTSPQLTRYDQLGRTPHSWCLYVSKWIQNSFVAKHNNKIKSLEFDVPKRFGIFFSSQQNLLSFYDANSRTCLYTFKQVKCSQLLIPGFSLWCGSLLIHTGLQVPTWVQTYLANLPKDKTLSTLPSE